MPSSLRNILGQSRAIESLQTALKSDRLHHAWIFHGPPGVGKHTTALAFATILLDPHIAPGKPGAVWIESAPDSHTAHLIDAGTHPDLHLVNRELTKYSRDKGTRDRKQTTIPIDVVREFVTEPASRTGQAANGARANKVFIIDEAELLASDSQNTLLKTLEEPPPGTVLILITSNEEKLLPTIRSRCQRIAFSRLGPEDMERWLAQRNVSLKKEQRDWLLRFADGSPGLAQMALDHGLHQWFVTLRPMLDEIDTGRFPAELGTTMATFVNDFALGWQKARPNASKEAGNRHAADYLFILLAAELRRLLRQAVERDEPPDLPLHALDCIDDARRQIDSNLNLTLVLENLAIQWAEAATVAR